jgi:glutamine amidotransferase
MCRWVAYFGNPIRPETLLYDTPHSLVEQSRRDRLAGGYPNADGLGLGWYGDRDLPGLYRSVAPAWGDRNLRELAGQIETPLFLAHIRAATGTPVEQTNCHPFRHGRWLFMHNGFIERYHEVRRDLLLAVDPGVFGDIEGTTDSELMLHLALTFGLELEPLTALEHMAGFVEETGRRHDVAEPLQMTIAVSDGERLYAARYASGPVVNSLFVTADASAVRALHPDDARFRQFTAEARAIVSEPLGDLPGLWREVPAGTAFVVQPGRDEQIPFTPRSPAGKRDRPSTTPV